MQSEVAAYYAVSEANAATAGSRALFERDAQLRDITSAAR
jgi:hypothetical protein